MARTPLFVRPLTDAERQALEAALRSPDAVVRRRARILLASARGEHTGAIAATVGFSAQGVRRVIHAFAQEGLGVLQRRPTTPHAVA
jgi:transposase